jgi:hypothetical protein
MRTENKISILFGNVLLSLIYLNWWKTCIRTCFPSFGFSSLSFLIDLFPITLPSKRNSFFCLQHYRKIKNSKFFLPFLIPSNLFILSLCWFLLRMLSWCVLSFTTNVWHFTRLMWKSTPLYNFILSNFQSKFRNF